MRTKSFCLFDGDFSTPCVRFWCSYVAESRVHFYGAGCLVEMCASYVHSGLFTGKNTESMLVFSRRVNQTRPIIALKPDPPPFHRKVPRKRDIIGMTVLIIIAVEPKICQEREGNPLCCG